VVTAEDVVHIEGVEVLKRTDWSLWCRIGAKELTVPAQVIHAPRPLPLPGERVTLVVPKWFAVDNGLV
jgi:hypothetical protein